MTAVDATGTVDGAVDAALERLGALLDDLGPVVVAFSGGTDSAFLARVAHDLLGPDNVLCATALSPSLAPEEEADCRALAEEWDTAREMARDEDPETREWALQEAEHIHSQLNELDRELTRLLTPEDPNDQKNVVVEIRAGAGGEEAALFAASLFRMYGRFAERQGWRTEMLSSSPTDIGGFKEVIFLVEGRGAFSQLKFESGVHRVQRVPVTEAQGRIHTSTVTVAVLPEAEALAEVPAAALLPDPGSRSTVPTSRSAAFTPGFQRYWANGASTGVSARWLT